MALVKICYGVVVTDEFRRALAYWKDNPWPIEGRTYVWKPRMASDHDVKEFYKFYGTGGKDLEIESNYGIWKRSQEFNNAKED